MSYVIAIDQSTSATKAILYDAGGCLIDQASRDHRQIYPQPGWVEHDLDEIWNNVLAAAGELLARNPGAARATACVSIANQRETIGVFERGSGRPLHNAIVWQCRRGAPICRELAEAGHGERVTQLTGLRLDTYFSASKLKWLVAHDPELARRLRDGDALIGTIDAYLIHRLTGGAVFATDTTNASRTLLYDIGRLGWDEWLCGLFDVPVQALPEVRESAACFGETTLGGLLSEPVPIRGVMGDSQASLFAQRCFEPGDAKVTFGTGSSVLLNIGDRMRLSPNGSVTTIAWVLGGRPVYSFEGIINYSAASIAWLKDQVGLLGSAREAGEIAAGVPDNGGVYLVPAFAGLSAPYWKPEARAAIVGITPHTNRAHLVRAAEESIAYQLRDVLEMMRADSDVDIQSIWADGGPTRDGFLMQFTADLLGIDLHVAETPNGSALGAAVAGMLGSGLYRSLDEVAARPRETQTYSPRMDPADAQRLVEGWKTAVRRVF